MQPSDRPALLEATDDAVERAASVLQEGGLVAFPTETVYGLGADASNPVAVGRIFEVKGRPVDHPLIVHLPSVDALGRWARRVPAAAEVLAGALWPGPLTLVLERSARVPGEVTGGRPTVGLRVPDQPVARRLLHSFGDGIAAPSANRFGRVSPTTAQHVVADLGADVDVVLDGGPCRVGLESTIVEVTGDGLTILRAGAVTAEMVEAITGVPVQRVAQGPARAPGMLASHYAPSARVVLASAGEVADTVASLLRAGQRVAVLAEVTPPGVPGDALVLGEVGDAAGYARLLYRRLREADAAGADVVVAVPPEDTGIGVAVCDRLRRAAASG